MTILAMLCLLAATIVVSATATGPGWASEVDALLAWKASLVVNTTTLSSWTQDVQVCNWTGVACSSANRVIQLGVQGRGISGKLGTLDTVSLPALIVLIVRNTKLQGPIPASISRLRSLRLLDLSDNRFSGYIPPQLGNMHNLRYLRLYGNNLVGHIPDRLCGLRKVQVLDLANNRLTGELQDCFCNLTTLLLIDLSKNRLTGELPGCWWNLRALKFMDLSSNSLGEIPLAKERHNCSPGSLYLAENSFTGAFQPVLKGCSYLATLEIGNNMFFGGIPPWIGTQVPSLRILSLRSHNFTGEILPELSQLSKLQLLDMANNSFTGSIPVALGDLPSMRHPQNLSTPVEPVPVVLQKYKDRISVVWKGHKLIFQKTTVSLLTGIDISSNALSRCIPEELTNLQGLRFLNTSTNHLSCGIPQHICRLNFLESLDISSNQLSGAIPQSISNLSDLSTFSVSNNHLSGKIPTGTQILTLTDPSMYSNNSGLCEYPLLPCAMYERNTTNDINGQGEDPWLYYSVIAGIVIGFWLWFVLLFTVETWRYGFHSFVDDMQHKIMQKMSH